MCPSVETSDVNATDMSHAMSFEDLKYFHALSTHEQARMKDMFESIINTVPGTNIPTLFKIIGSNMPDNIKNTVLKKHIVTQRIDKMSGEYIKSVNWIEQLCKIPFGEYIPMPVNRTSSLTDIVSFIDTTKSKLDKEVFGHDETKKQIIRIIAQWIGNPNSKGNVIGIHGNPGVGKTTLIKDGVCEALGLPFAFIPLGGASDGSYLEGHSYTYEGSMCGRIVDAISSSRCMNPIIYFDELDKISNTMKGREIINLLIHITDPAQNTHFYDKYFSSIPIDLSKCLFIFTYNDVNMVSPILKDRMITIHTKDYTLSDKINISTNHLIPSIKKDFMIDDITIDTETITHIIKNTHPEPGVRNLRRNLELIISNINLEILSGNYQETNNIDIKTVDKYIIRDTTNDINPSLSHMYM